jgi:hypothetical protein
MAGQLFKLKNVTPQTTLLLLKENEETVEIYFFLNNSEIKQILKKEDFYLFVEKI